MFSYKHNSKLWYLRCKTSKKFNLYCLLFNALEFVISKLTTDERFLSFSKGVKIVISIKDSICTVMKDSIRHL